MQCCATCVLCHGIAAVAPSSIALFTILDRKSEHCCGTLQISGCVVHESGALLIEPGSAAGYDMMLRRVAPRTSPSGASCVLHEHITWT